MAIFKCAGSLFSYARRNRQTTKKEQADKHTRKETTKITKENSTGTKHRWEHAECDHVKKAAEKRSEAESFKNMKIKYPTHLNMAM
jgi:hypothetical protein